MQRARPLIPGVLAIVLFVPYALFSLVRHARMETAGYDLGIFDQAIRSYAHFRAPVSSIKGPDADLLGDHFHPALALLAPLYWVWSDPRMLLLAQSALIAVSVIPVARLSVSRLGPMQGTVVALGYGLSWGIQGAIAFDFHEVALAVPLMAFAMTALADRRWRTAVVFTLTLLLVKEDLGLAVSAVGGYLILQRRVWIGLATMSAGVTGLLLAVLVIIPRLSQNGQYHYWGQVTEGGHQSLTQTLLGLPASFVQHPEKAVLILCLSAVTAGVALRSPLVLIAAPLVLYRVVSTNPLQWSVGPVHYNAVLMPILFVAALDAVTGLRTSRRRWCRRYAAAAPAAIAVIGIGLLPFFPFNRMVLPSFYRTTEHVTAARALLAQIPSGARVAASNRLAPQLTARCQVTLFADVHHRPVDWIVVDGERLDGIPAPPEAQRSALAQVPEQGFRLVAQRDGILLFHRT